jgi:hypothetical protein
MTDYLTPYQIKVRGNKAWLEIRIVFIEEEDHAGLGVTVSTGYGDGLYPVEVKRTSKGRIAEVRIVFIEEEDED